MLKSALKIKAVSLRKAGFSYKQILAVVPVAKSTLSIWLKSVNLSTAQKQALTDRKILAARRGGEAVKLKRIEQTKHIVSRAETEVGAVTSRELWLAGVMLYWAEGTKDKEYKPGTAVIFSNSDPAMIRVFLVWLDTIIKVPNDQICFEIYVHESCRNQVEKLKKYWADSTGFPPAIFTKVYYKTNKRAGNKGHKGVEYHGLLRIVVKRSSTLNRKITGWIKGFCDDAESSNGRTPLFGSGYSRFES